MSVMYSRLAHDIGTRVETRISSPRHRSSEHNSPTSAWHSVACLCYNIGIASIARLYIRKQRNEIALSRVANILRMGGGEQTVKP